MDPSLIFPPFLSLEAERDLRERLRAQRLAQFRALLPESEKFGALATYVRAVGRLHSTSAARAMAYLDRWPTTYFISRVLHHGLDPSAAAGRLMSGLLFESSDDGSSPLWGLDFTVQTDADGSVVVPDQAGHLVISGLRRESQTLHWKCEAHRALVSTACGGQSRATRSSDSRSDGAAPVPSRSCHIRPRSPGRYQSSTTDAICCCISAGRLTPREGSRGARPHYLWIGRFAEPLPRWRAHGPSASSG